MLMILSPTIAGSNYFVDEVVAGSGVAGNSEGNTGGDDVSAGDQDGDAGASKAKNPRGDQSYQSWLEKLTAE